MRSRTDLLLLVGLLVVVGCALALGGIWLHARMRPQPGPKLGPPFIAFIVDSSASVSGYHDSLVAYAEQALHEYSQMGPVHLILVNLNEAPTKDYESQGDLTSSDIDEVVGRLKRINYKAKGTDVISALELAQRYYDYACVKAKPSAFYILCFTDGIIQPAPGQKVRPWKDFDWTKLASDGAQMGIYFLDPRVRPQVEEALAPLIKHTIIREGKDAVADAQNGAFDLPGIGR